MIIVLCTDDHTLVQIAVNTANKSPGVFGSYYKIYDDFIPTLNQKENLFIISHGAYEGDEGRPVIGDKMKDFYLNGEDLYLNLKKIFPEKYKGNIFIDACESADYRDTVSFIEIFKTHLNLAKFQSRVFGRAGKSSGLIPLPTDKGWVDAKSAIKDITEIEFVKEWAKPVSSVPILSLTPETAATASGNFLGYETSDPKAQGMEIYQKIENLPTAVASILNHCQNRANFHPANTPSDLLASAFDKYILEIDDNKFIGLLDSNGIDKKVSSSDYNKLIDTVVNVYQGVESEGLNAIKTSIADMAKSVFGQREAEEWKNIFSQSTIDMSDLDHPKLMIYYTTLHMYHKKSRKSEVKSQSFNVRRITYGILTEKIKYHASRLAALDKKSIDDWVNSSTSPQRNYAKLCFEVKPLRMVA